MIIIHPWFKCLVSMVLYFTQTPAIWDDDCDVLHVRRCSHLFPCEVLDEGQISGVDHCHLKQADRLSHPVRHKPLSLQHTWCRHGQAVWQIRLWRMQEKKSKTTFKKKAFIQLKPHSSLSFLRPPPTTTLLVPLPFPPHLSLLPPILTPVVGKDGGGRLRIPS